MQKKDLPSLEELDSSIKKAKDRAGIKDKSKEKKEKSAIATSARVGVDLCAGVLVGAVIGYNLDEFFDTKPILFIVFFIIGVIAGFLNIYRFVNKD